MDQTGKLYLALCWHMHQPDYRNRVTGEFELPWTYLHAIKDYTDMAYHLEQHPGVHTVVNFVPSLLDQLEEYRRQFEQGQVHDPLLALLGKEDLNDVSLERRQQALNSCFHSNHQRMIAPFPAYSRLHQMFTMLDEMSELQTGYLSAQYLADLLVWYHLAWTGESVRRTSELVQRLMAKGSLFAFEDRKALFDLIGQLIADVIPRYRKLQDRGQIEISTTPCYHPILPLLIDFESAHEAMPGATLPRTPKYPGGVERSAKHVEWAQANYRAHFGREAHGMWPAEGSVSLPALGIFAAHGCKWTASGEAVLFNSLHRMHGDKMPDRLHYLYRPYHCTTERGEIFCFFRDDRLSDKIGFEYTKWHGRDAVSDFIHSLEEIHRQSEPGEDVVVSVILDGENAWEYYPYNGYYFLSDLYDALQQHPFISTSTFAECVGKLTGGAGSEGGIKVKPENLPTIAAGSWVYGTFSTWIGMTDKNNAWDMLCAAKTSYDRVLKSGRLSEDEQESASQQLGICEGSDWFWWFGDYNSAVSVQSFERLYRTNLSNLYQLLKLPVPVELQHPISVGRGHPEAGGAMRRAA